MGVIRIPEEIWQKVYSHLSRAGEHFAFLRARWTYSIGEPVFIVTGATLVPDAGVTFAGDGHELSLAVLLEVINEALRVR